VILAGHTNHACSRDLPGQHSRPTKKVTPPWSNEGERSYLIIVRAWRKLRGKARGNFALAPPIISHGSQAQDRDQARFLLQGLEVPWACRQRLWVLHPMLPRPSRPASS
jgi:hypothetical protein